MLPILRTFSLKARLIIIYVFILGVGGILTSFIGSLIVNDTIMNQARSKVYHDLKTARMVYDNQLLMMRQELYAVSRGNKIENFLESGNSADLLAYLSQVFQDLGLDFLSVTDANGKVIFRTTPSRQLGNNMADIPLIQAALLGKVGASTEVLSWESLQAENPEIVEQSYIRFVETPMAAPTDKTEETSGMVLMAAAPIFGKNDKEIGVLYGGHLLNRNFKIVDRVWELVYRGERYQDKDIGTVTIFLHDLRISTNVKTKAGARALGTRVSAVVNEAVLVKGEEWSDRAFVVNDWYISRYEPIRNFQGDIVGILYVGVLERAYLAIRNRVILTFISIASLGFLFIILISYLITRSITRPLSELVQITKLITAGDLNHEMKVTSSDEIGQLGLSFNTMVKSLKRMKVELEEWGKTLEQKVIERTEELKAMQARVIQTERLASLGQMAAGIAHEINNPLGGILVLSSLTLEDLKNDDPNRQNLEEVVKQTIRCRDIVKGLLQFSRQTETKKSLIKMNDILNNTLSLIQKQAMFHNIDVEKNFHPELPFVMVDESQYQQVFMNIIINAIQSMKEIGTLTIETLFNEKDNMVVVNIADTGSGIPHEIIDKIFDPFFTTKEVGKGTGLGLSIAYGIVTRHNGRMTVKSEVHKGTTFSIQTPVATDTMITK
ncbi:cache domain-containing protein [candidate division KSB1 bacterium]|nr:cache domain-containing protein [candidate division KSB1 bacterium]